jgi:pilus assembly protein CpaB
MKPKTMILAVVAVGCGLVASYLTNQLLAQRRLEADNNKQMVQVLVARTKIQAYTPITEPEKMFVFADYPADLAKKAITSVDKVRGQRLNKTLEEAKPVFEDDLMNPDQAGLEAMLKPGQRAISIKVDAVTLIGGWCRPGARVDVYCTTRGGQAQAKIILQNMLILAVDTTKERSPDQPTIAGQTVVVAASPEEAAQLTLASSVGELRLALRPYGDNKSLGRVEAKQEDLGKPVSDSVEGGNTEPPETASRPSAKVDIPRDLPAIEEKKEPVVAAPKVVKPAKSHIMNITLGQNKSQIVFPPKDGGVEEETPAPSDENRTIRPEPPPAPPTQPGPAAKPGDKQPTTGNLPNPLIKSGRTPGIRTGS